MASPCLRATSPFNFWQKDHQTVAVPARFIHHLQFLTPWIMSFFTLLEIWKSLSLDRTRTWTLYYDRGHILLGCLKIAHLCSSCPPLLPKDTTIQLPFSVGGWIGFQLSRRLIMKVCLWLHMLRKQISSPTGPVCRAYIFWSLSIS